MSQIVNLLTTETIRANALSATNTALGIVAVILLVGLFLLKELIRPLGGPRGRLWGQTADTLILPLGLAFAIILVTRFMALVGR